MKVELTENSVKLTAENKFEKQALERLRIKGVESVKFEDDWDQEGALILNHGNDDWDTPGRR